MMFNNSPSLPIYSIDPPSIPLSTGKGSEVKKIDEGKLKKACADFESIFISQMLKVMRQTIPKSEFLDGGSQQNAYLSLFDEELSKSFAKKGGIGLGKMLYQNIMNQTKKTNLDAGASSANPTAISEKLFFRSEK